MAKRLYFKDYYYLQGNNVHIHGVGGFKVPTGDTNQRPTVMEGIVRYNTETNSWELGTHDDMVIFNTNNDGSSTFYTKQGGTLFGDIIMDDGRKIQNADGSYIRPSYGFANDLDTGLFRSAENTIDVVVGGELNSNSVPAIRVSRNGSSTGDFDQVVEINADLVINGTVTNVNSVDLEVEDNTITLNKNGTNAGRSGIEIEANGAIASRFYYDFSKSKWSTNNISITDIPLPAMGTDVTNKNYVDVEIQTLDDDLSAVIAQNYQTLDQKIDNEINRATTRENTIESNLNAEITRATGEEQRIEDKFDNAVTNLNNTDASLQQQINNEVTRATGEEQRIENKFDTSVTNLNNTDADLQQQITNEVTRATTREDDLQQQITDEVNRATTRENNIDTALTNEITRATNEEQRIETKFDNAISSSQSTDADLQQQITDEVTRATGEEQRIENKFDTSVTNLNNTDADLQQQITDEVSRATTREDDLQTQIDGKEDTLGFTPEDSANKSQPNGYASLDSNGKVPTSELPNSVFGGIVYQGGWDAINNTPTLQSGVGTRGNYYKVNNASTNTTLNTELDGVTDWAEGDLLLFNGTAWEKFDQTDKVTSVRGTNNTIPKVGDVVLSLQDVGASAYGADLATATDAPDGRSKLGLGTASTLNTGTLEGQIPVRVVNGDLTGNLLGNANTASELQTARTFNFLGDATGSASFKGDSNIDITLTVQDDSHNHIISNVDGLQSVLDGLQNSIDGKLDDTATATNSDLLDNISSEQFLRSDVSDLFTYTNLGLGTGLILEANSDVNVTHSGLVMKAGTNPTAGDRLLTVKSAGESPRLIVEHDGAVKTSNSDMYVGVDVAGTGGNRVFHEGFHPNADALTNSVSLSLSGDVSGTATTDWSGNVDIAVEVVNDSHTHEWSNITSKPVGSTGEVYYFANDGSAVESSMILQQLRIVDNAQRLSEEQQIVVSFEDVFNTWYRFSHGASETYPSDGTETNAWSYQSATDTVECTINSATHVGFVSEEKYSTYIHEATLTSAGADNDMLGVVIAFDFDENDLVTNNAYNDDPSNYSWDINTTDALIPNEHTLTLIRTRSTEAHLNVNSTPVQYAVVYNYNKPDEKVIANGDALINDTVGNFSGVEAKVRVERNGDIINVWTTEWSDSTSYDGTLKGNMTIDLTSDPDLEKFRGDKSYGYSALSQPSATYKDILFTDPSGRIYDVSTDTSWYYDGTQWIQDSNTNVQSEIGVGRLIQNPTDKNIYFVKSQDEVVKIYDYDDPNNYYTKTEVGNLLESLKWNTEVTLSGGGTQVFDLNTIFGTNLGDSRDVIVDIKVLDNTSGSPTNGMWIDASAVATYGINTTNETVTIINEYTNSLTFYIRISL